jgi:hypothetical protein
LPERGSDPPQFVADAPDKVRQDTFFVRSQHLS